MTYYEVRLAQIHAQDYTQYAIAAAERLLAEIGPGAKFPGDGVPVDSVRQVKINNSR